MKLKFGWGGRWSVLVAIALLVVSCTTTTTEAPIAEEIPVQRPPAVAAGPERGRADSRVAGVEWQGNR